MSQSVESRAKAAHGKWGRFWSGCRCETCDAACPHGTVSGYTGWKCRCSGCRAANTQRAGRLRRVRVKDFGCCRSCGKQTREPKARGIAPLFCLWCRPSFVAEWGTLPWGIAAEKQYAYWSFEDDVLQGMGPDVWPLVKECPIIPADLRSGAYLLVVTDGGPRIVTKRTTDSDLLPWHDVPVVPRTMVIGRAA